MKKIVKLEWELLRYKYSFFGFFNMTIFVLIAGIILSGIKVILHYIGHYEELSTFLLIAIMTLFSEKIYPERLKENYIRNRVYFDSIEAAAAKKFYSIKNYILYLIVFTYILFPISLKCIPLFLFYFLICNLWILIISEAKIVLPISRFNSFNLILKVSAYLYLFLYMKEKIHIELLSVFNIYHAIVFFMIALLIIVKNVKCIQLGVNGREDTISFLAVSRCPIINKDYNLIYIVRKKLFIEPILIILMGNITISKNIESLEEQLFTIVLSFVFAYITLYMDIVINEKGKITYFYELDELKQMRIRSLLSVLKTAPFLLIVVILPLCFIMDIKIILIGFVISISVFIVTTLLTKMSIEKQFDYKRGIKIIDILKITLFASVASGVFSYFVEYIIENLL